MLDRTEVDVVREGEETIHPTRDAVLRIKVRVDVWLDEERYECSMVAWKSPQRELVCNELWSGYDVHHIGMAPADICAIIAEAVDFTPEPF